MKKVIDNIIVLRRTNYGENDRVITAICENHGKTAFFVKSARTQKSRLNAGTQLLAINEVGFIEGRSNLKTITSAQMMKSFDNIVNNFKKAEAVFENYKNLDKIIEEDQGQEFYNLLAIYLEYVNDEGFNWVHAEIWFRLHMLKQMGLISELKTDENDSSQYDFDFENQTFKAREQGAFTANDIKFFRVMIQVNRPAKITNDLSPDDLLLNFTRLLLENNLF